MTGSASSGRLGGPVIAADLLTCLLTVLFQALVPPRFGLSGPFGPDLLLLVLAYKAITRRQESVLAYTALAALCVDALNPGALFGVHLVAKLPVMMGISLTRRSIPREKRFMPFLMVFVAGAAVHNLLIAVLLAVRGVQTFGYLAGNGLASAFVTSLVGAAVLGVRAGVRGGFHGRYGY